MYLHCQTKHHSCNKHMQHRKHLTDITSRLNFHQRAHYMGTLCFING